MPKSSASPGIRNAFEQTDFTQGPVSRDVLLFDFGGTLEADGDPWAARFHRSYAAAGGCLPFIEFAPMFKLSDQQLEAEPAIPTMGFRAMIDAQAELLRRLLPDGLTVDLDRVADIFHREALATVERNRPMLARLSARYRLGVVSNFTGNLARCLAELDLLRLFAIVTDSAVVGFAKPDPRIFQLPLEALRAPPRTAWMIGDNAEADVRPAALLGLRTCWLAGAQRRPPRGVVPTARITRLTDLPAAIAACTD